MNYRSVVSHKDENWRRASIRYAHALLDRNNDIVTVTLQKTVDIHRSGNSNVVAGLPVTMDCDCVYYSACDDSSSQFLSLNDAGSSSCRI